MLAKLGYKKAINVYISKEDDMPITLNGIIDELNNNDYGNIAQDLELLVKKRNNNEDTFEVAYRIKDFCGMLTEQDKKTMKQIMENTVYGDIKRSMEKIDEVNRQMENVMNDILPKLELVMRNIMNRNKGNFIDFEGTHIRRVKLKEDLKIVYFYYDASYGGLLEKYKHELTPQSIYGILERLKTGKYTVQLRR